MEYKYAAIVLSKKDVGEADRLYTFFTLEGGKIKAGAAGVRKSQSRLAGTLENFNLVDLSVNRGRGTGRVTGAICEENFPELRKNIESLEPVIRNLKLFDRMVGLEVKDQNLFKLLYSYLAKTEKASAVADWNGIALISQAFIFKLLNQLGYAIETGRCVICQGQLAPAVPKAFDAGHGGIICQNCRKSGLGIEVSDNLIKLLRIFSANSLGAVHKIKVGRSEQRELELIAENFLRWTTN